MKTSKDFHHETISRIPKDLPPITTAPKRTVHIGYRPVGGKVAAWTIGILDDFLKRLCPMVVDSDQNDGPNPHHHWCIVVGHYYHHAQIANGLIWYENDKLSWSKWGDLKRNKFRIEYMNQEKNYG